MERIRRQYTAEQKVAILRKHLLEQVPVSDLCDKHGLNSAQLYPWQRQFFENGAAAFARPGRAGNGEKAASGKVSYRFEWSWKCRGCGQREACVGAGQAHRSLVVGEHHDWLQARRKEMATEAFAEAMNRRAGIEGTISELVREHGLRRARYRGLKKVALQNGMIGAACNVKRWLRRWCENWTLRQREAAWLGARVCEKLGRGMRGGRLPEANRRTLQTIRIPGRGATSHSSFFSEIRFQECPR